jgi:hypothetical protein
MKITKLVEEFAMEREDHKRLERLKAKGQRIAFWASEASIRRFGFVYGKCLRALYWDFKGQSPTNPMDARALRTVTCGIEFENRMNNDIKEMGLWDFKMNAKKKFFNEELNVSAEVDAFVLLEEQSVGLEYKTIYGYYSKKEIFTKRKPKVEALMQVLIYLYHFKVPFKLIYGTRDSQEVTEFDVTLDNLGYLKIDNEDPWIGLLSITDIKNRFDEFKKFQEENTIPPRDYPVLGFSVDDLEAMSKLKLLTKTDTELLKAGKKIKKIPWQCTYCRFYFKCKNEAKRESGIVEPEEDLMVPFNKIEEQVISEEEEFTY